MEKEWLLGEFKRRKATNAAYSLRSFSRAVKVSPGRLSEYLGGKRPLTQKMARKIALELGVLPNSAPAAAATAQPYQPLESEVFAAVADWQHYAILSLAETKGFRTDEKWIARRLGISPLEARDSIARLVRLGLAELKAGKLVPTKKNLSTSHDVASAALRKSHAQSLSQAIATLEEVPVELRDITSITMAIDTRKLGLAKDAIKDFRRRLSQLLEAGEADEVYNLNIQLVPVTRK